jgi:phage shock protein E
MVLRISRHFWITLIFLLLAPLCASSEIVQLNSTQFYQRAFVEGSVDVIVDVRTRSEWESGHIEGALFLENLGNAGTASEITSPADLAGCEYCEIIVYCQSGNRAGKALLNLQAAGFQKIYNGQGATQWTAALYELVTTPSVPAECTTNSTKSAACQAAFDADSDSMAEDNRSGEMEEMSYAVGTPCLPGVGLAATLWVVWTALF